MRGTSSPIMQTVDKAVELLGYFSERQPEFGLSELARTVGFDKASTRRLLLALIKHDYIEQNPTTKAYRLGIGVLRLARVRETSTPTEAIVNPLLQRLVTITGESAHFSILSGGRISSVGIVESSKSNRINFVQGEEGSVHATSSGIVCLAFSSDEAINEVLKSGLEAFTEHTITNPRQFRKMLQAVREEGYHINNELYEKDVCSIAAPVFNQELRPIGAIAVAAPTSRFDSRAKKKILTAVYEAGVAASRAFGAEIDGSKL
ncbi:MAG: IclR family transcriptional regulator [Porticoccaceae bacterium]|nr:IclR family transcriptional regulator [Porticoccaceae bacterium]MBT6422202.1 IclR family transcriptional regulator [Porticoccaceae bacterium]MBT6692259.1 IclR family transcriptional regulator [Porticoccaceae bacterium]MBT6799712.1 IclR family transcriptional regulator [Porticoccaceae bacterium]MBT7752518.1 IclR family transcriptional regulator [Porticoccaceae bacterium]